MRLGLAKGITAEIVQKRPLASERLYILDVRELKEVEASPLPIEGTIVNSLGELQDRWGEIKLIPKLLQSGLESVL